MDDISDADSCSIATDAAMDVALEECTESGLLENLSRIVGLEEPPEPRETPDELSAPECMEMDEVRRWVVVRSKELIDGGDGLTDSIEKAWIEAGDQCGW